MGQASVRPLNTSLHAAKTARVLSIKVGVLGYDASTFPLQFARFGSFANVIVRNVTFGQATCGYMKGPYDGMLGLGPGDKSGFGASPFVAALQQGLLPQPVITAWLRNPSKKNGTEPEDGGVSRLKNQSIQGKLTKPGTLSTTVLSTHC